MRFLVDNQLPATLADWLRTQGHAAQHVLEIGLAQSKDNPIWRLATEQNLIVITKDEDFAEWVRRGRSGPVVVWVRIGNASNPTLLAHFERGFPFVLAQLESGARLVEMR